MNHIHLCSVRGARRSDMVSFRGVITKSFQKFVFLLSLGVPQAILLVMATKPRAVDSKVSCSQIPRRPLARIRTHDPMVESPTS
jgi:hypothetical protein